MRTSRLAWLTLLAPLLLSNPLTQTSANVMKPVALPAVRVSQVVVSDRWWRSAADRDYRRPREEYRDQSRPRIQRRMAIRSTSLTGTQCVDHLAPGCRSTSRSPHEINLGFKRVTRYCWTGNVTSDHNKWPKLGIVAVQNYTIRYGTKVHIHGLGTFVVGDHEPKSGVSDFDVYTVEPDCNRRTDDWGINMFRVTLTVGGS